MKTAEVIYGGLWAASAVTVAGYTWKAFTGEYQRFNNPGGGGGSDSNASATAAGLVGLKGISTISKAGGIVGRVARKVLLPLDLGWTAATLVPKGPNPMAAAEATGKYDPYGPSVSPTPTQPGSNY